MAAPSSSTLWCASYPKSGNTWVRALLRSLASGAAPDLNDLGATGFNPVQLRSVLGLGQADLSKAEAAQVRRLAWAQERNPNGGFIPRKTHEAWLPAADGFPLCWQPEGAKALYVVRDPRAVAVSWAYHLDLPITETVTVMQMSDFSAVPEDALAGFRSGSWSEHVRSWLDQDELPVLLVRYEDLLANPLHEVTRIAAWADLPTDPEHVAAAAAACSFTNLAVAEILGGFAERASADRPFFRKGEAESWRDELPEDLAAQIETHHAAVMERLGYLPG